MVNKWIVHVKKVKEKNPKKTLKEVLQLAEINKVEKKLVRTKLCRDCNVIYQTPMRFSKFCAMCRDIRAPNRWYKGDVANEKQKMLF